MGWQTRRKQGQAGPRLVTPLVTCMSIAEPIGSYKQIER